MAEPQSEIKSLKPLCNTLEVHNLLADKQENTEGTQHIIQLD